MSVSSLPSGAYTPIIPGSITPISDSRRIRDAIGIPLFLAGGLTPANVADAIAAVEPFGLDLCSGVRTNDDLDAVKLRAFFAAVPNGAA